MKTAVIGAGISGLSSAYRLVQAGADVTLFEAGRYFGGHSNTVDVDVDGVRFGVDTGFLVFNERTYPKLIGLFAELGVESVASDMSFSVKLPLAGRTLEWAGSSLDTVFAQRRNLFNPRFLRMVRDILRFNKEATLLAIGGDAMPAHSLGQFLDERRQCFPLVSTNYSASIKPDFRLLTETTLDSRKELIKTIRWLIRWALRNDTGHSLSKSADGGSFWWYSLNIDVSWNLAFIGVVLSTDSD